MAIRSSLKLVIVAMGLREKVTLVLIAVVFYKTVCTICVLQENPFDKYTNKRKYDKSKLLSKSASGNNRKTFSEIDYLPDTTSKFPVYLQNTEYDISGKSSSIDVFSDSTLLSNLRKEKRRKRKNQQTQKRNSREHDLLVTVPEPLHNQDYFTAMERFPEVQYPLTASDIWAPSYWNPPYNDKDTNLKRDDYNYESQNKINKPAETLIKSHNEINKNKMEPLMKKNKKMMTENTPQLKKMKSLSITSTSSEPRKSLLMDNNPKTRVKSKKDPNSLRKALSKSVGSGSKQVSMASTNKHKMILSDNIMPSSNSTTANTMNSTSEKVSNIQNLELENYIILRKTELDNYITDKLLKEYIREHAISPLVTSTVSNPTLKEQKDTFNNDLSSGDTLASYFESNNPTINNTSEKDLTGNKSVEENCGTCYKNNTDPIDDNLNSNDTLDNSSTQLKFLFDSITNKTKSTEESKSSYRPQEFINGLQRKESSNDTVSFIDDLIRQRILDILSTKNLSVTSLRESILKILVTEEHIYNELKFKSAINDSSLNKNIFETTIIVNPLSEDILQLPVTNSQVFNESQQSEKSSSEYSTHVDDLAPINPSQLIDDSSSEIIFEPFVIENSDNIIQKPKSFEIISKDTYEAQPIVTQVLAENLREIISKPSSSHALVKDLLEIIRLLTIWNSRIDDSNEVDYKTNTNAKIIENKFISNSSEKVIFNSTIINKPTKDLQKLIPEFAIDEISFDSKVLNQSASDNLVSEKPSSDTRRKIKYASNNNDTFPEKYESETIKIIPEFVVNNNETIFVIPQTDSGEKNVEGLEDDNLLQTPTTVLHNNSSRVFTSSIFNSSFMLYENFTTDPDQAYSSVTDQRTEDISESVASEFVDHDLSKVPIEVILEPIDTELNIDDFIESISELSIVNNLNDALKSDRFNDNVIHDSKLESDQTSSDELREIVNHYRINDTNTNETESLKYPPSYSFDNIITSLIEEEELFPMSFDSSYMPLTDESFHSILNETESGYVKNLLNEEQIPNSTNRSLENVCMMNEDSAFKNQCYSIDKSDDFDSISNLTDLVTGKLLLSNVKKPLDTSLDDFTSHILPKDFIMTYVSNSTKESQINATLSNFSDVDNLLISDEIPDFSDYNSSPEEDELSDFYDSILINNVSYYDHSADAVLTDQLLKNNKHSTVPDFNSLEMCSEINSIKPNKLTLGQSLNTTASDFEKFDDMSSIQNIPDELLYVTACNEYVDTCFTMLDNTEKKSMTIDNMSDLEKPGNDTVSDILNATDVVQIYSDTDVTPYEIDEFIEPSFIAHDTGRYNESSNEIVMNNYENDTNKLYESCYVKLVNTETSGTEYNYDTEDNNFPIESSCSNTANNTLIDELSNDPKFEEPLKSMSQPIDKSETDQTTSSSIETQIAQFDQSFEDMVTLR